MPFLATTYFSFLGFFLEACILLSVTFFFSSFAKPFLAITASLSFFLIGHWVTNLEFLIEKSKSLIFVNVGNVIIRVLPHLEALNWRSNAISKVSVHPIDLSYGLYMSFAWALFFFMLSIMIFRRKDFE